MAIRSELANDAERGPGHGLIRIAGLPAGSVPQAYCLERNQGVLPYLGASGAWQAQETWHAVTAMPATGEEPVELRVGPEVVDALVEQPQHVVCRLMLDCGGERQIGALRLQRPLLSSKAQGLPATPVEVEPLPAEPEPAAELPPPGETQDAFEAMVPEPVVADGQRQPWRIALWALIPTGLLAVGGWLWWDCRLPGLPGPECAGGEASAVALVPSAEALPKNCSGLDGEGCLAVAIRAAETGQLDRARQLLQEAGNLGAVKAYLRLAQMYDPATWAADKSPVERPDWETAAYWYDEAARAGDGEGRLGAGRLYCGSSSDAAFRSHGADLLRQSVAAAPGDAAAAQALKDCEEKLK